MRPEHEVLAWLIRTESPFRNSDAMNFRAADAGDPGGS